MLIVTEWPSYQGLGDAKVDAEMTWVVDFISQVRSVRSEMNIPAGAKIDCAIIGANRESRRRTATWEQEIMRLARLKVISFEDKVPASSAQMVLGEATLALPLDGVIDFAAERAGLGKEREKVEKDIAVIEARLGNSGFVAKAPEEVLEETRERKTALAAQRNKLNEALNRLK
jgi:valyl-tRNA synthetase